MEDISEIKRMRKKLGITQAELSNVAEVSQSLIAKLEAGKLDPSYSKTKKLFETLHSLSSKQQLQAKDILHRQIVSVTPETKLDKAIALMQKHAYSQLPVMHDHTAMGLLSETRILQKLSRNIHLLTVSEVMDDAPPLVPLSTPINVLHDLLRVMSAVLVADKGKIMGIITKSDLLAHL